MHYENTLDKTTQRLLIVFAFIFPLTVVGGNLLALLIILLGLLSGNLINKFKSFFKNKFFISSILFFLIHIIGLIWTSDYENGLFYIKKMYEFGVLLPILMVVVKKKNINFYLNSFLLSNIFIALISFLIWTEVIPPFKYASVDNPTPFMSHITHTPFMALSFYLLAKTFIFNIETIKKNRFILLGYTVSVLLIIWSVFFTQGRTGHAIFLILFFLLIYQSYGLNFKFFKFSLIGLIFLSLAFFTNSGFLKRAIETYNSLAQPSPIATSSTEIRINYLINSFELIKNKPIFGSGTGSFEKEYEKVNNVKSPHIKTTSQPHNMYVLVTTQFGIFGLLIFCYMFLSQILLSRKRESFIKDIGIAFSIFFIFINLGDSYLLGHYTSLLFVFFSSFLFQSSH